MARKKRNPRYPFEIRLDVEAALAVYASLRARVDVHDGVVRLRGIAPSEEIIREATRLAAAVDGVIRVDNELAVPEEFPVESSAQATFPAAGADLSLDEVKGLLRPENTADLQDDVGAADVENSVSEAEPYTAPMDPLAEPRGRELENLEVVGGFATTALDGPPDQGNHAPNAPHGDDEVARDIRLALRRDAATAGLEVQVEVHGGIVELRGRVSSLEDTDIVEEVVRRVPQVVDIHNWLLVEGIE